MKLSGVISSLNQNSKVAGAAPEAKPPVQQPASEKTAGAASALDAAVADALRTITGSTGKTASDKGSATGPEGQLESMAAKVASAGASDLDDMADRIGLKMSHGFVRGLNQAGEAAGALNKVASQEITAEEIALVKMARENPEAFLNDVREGYMAGMAEKQAASEKVVEAIHKIASDHYLGGYTAMSQVLGG